MIRSLNSFGNKYSRCFSSRRWLERQRHDPYVKKAIDEDLRARSAYKLKQIQEKHRVIKKSDIVIDLGSAPGGWSLVASEVLGKDLCSGPRLCSVDLLPMDAVPGAIILQGDFRGPEVQTRVRAMLDKCGGEGGANVVLSDILHNTTGHRMTDQLRSAGLVEDVLAFCDSFLRPGGTVLCKFLRGCEDSAILSRARESYKTVSLVKPAASRSDSSEIYLLARELK